MAEINREEAYTKVFETEPKYRLRQLRQSFYDPNVKNWEDITVLSKALREKLEGIPFSSFKETVILASKDEKTYKAVHILHNERKIESVLMQSQKGRWTICVSSQVGCAMACTFCATGKMGFVQNLSQDEIIDQYRHWNAYLKDLKGEDARISNIVFMGMGEPLANYENVKHSVKEILEYTDIGSTHIVVSTVGVLPVMEKLLKDEEWPGVRLAISVHSADRDTRKSIVPTSKEGFLQDLADWGKRYLEKFNSNRHYLTFEYVMLQGENDSEDAARQLANLANRIGKVKVNLIPYNSTDAEFVRSSKERLEMFLDILKKKGVTATIRQTQGQDIEAACGQLIQLQSKKK